MSRDKVSDVRAREEISLNRGWLFYDGDVTEHAAAGHRLAYMSAKTQMPSGTVFTQDFDDSGWRKIDLPHDFVLEHEPTEKTGTHGGCRERGVAWYRRYFKLSEADRGKNLELLFEGVSTFADVYFNGALMYSNRCGYTSFRCDVTPMAEYGDFYNTIAVRVDATKSEGWWYEGGGIYRNVWLIKRPPVHFVTDSIFANPVQKKGKWVIPFEAEIANTGTGKVSLEAVARVGDKDGKIIAEKVFAAACPAVFGQGKISGMIEIEKQKDIQLWDIDCPHLYKLTAVLRDKKSGAVLDETGFRIGFRTIAFDAETGFYLNGRNVKLQGTCNHQDHACVGVAVPESVERYRIRILKDMGCNAYRCSHNPPSRSLLDLCDETGMLVMDENRHFSTAEMYLGQLKWLVKRDRNHPSVIMWSIFNEEPLQGTRAGYEMARKMDALVKNLDSTRFTTGAMNGGYMNEYNASQALDVTGINYFYHEYDAYHKLAPEHPVLSSEDTSAVTSRGEAATDWKKHLLADNDTEAVMWGATQRKAWAEIAKRPFMAGGFVWTGFDYRGEPTPYNRWPSNVSFFGIVDLCGFPKNAFYIRQAQWRHDLSVLRIAPHWNLKVKKGTPVSVLVISSNAEKVKLWLNGKLIGEQKVDIFEYNTFSVPYEPGILKAVSYDEKGRKVAETENRTTGKAAALELEAVHKTICADGQDAAIVNVYAVDENGLRVPDAGNLVKFSLSGQGRIAGVGNGDENCTDSDLIPQRKLFNGCAQVILKSQAGAKGKLELTATAKGLKSAKCTMKITPDKSGRIYMDVPERMRQMRYWTRSPFTEKVPDLNVKLSKDDMNTWEVYTAGTKLKFEPGHYGMYRPGEDMDLAGEKIVFELVMGRARVYIGKKLLAEKSSPFPGKMQIQIPEKTGADDVLTVVLEADSAGYCGLTGRVVLAD